MGTSTTTDVKQLLDLAVRMGIPATEAMQQVREMHTEPEPADKAARPDATARPASA